MNIKTTTYNNTVIQPQLKAGAGIITEETKETKKQEKTNSKNELDYYVELVKNNGVSNASRIEEIKQQLKNGEYKVSPELIADAMFYQMNGVVE